MNAAGRRPVDEVAVAVPDAIFSNPRLAQIYDDVDADRSDLVHYVAMVDEFAPRSVLDVGCGTGTFASFLAGNGLEVIGVDPAAASLDVARRGGVVREHARQHLVHGDAKGIQIRGEHRAALELLRGHVGRAPDDGRAVRRDLQEP